MQVIKPRTLGLLPRSFLHGGQARLALATLAFFRLGERPGATLLPEHVQWPLALEATGGQPLDLGLPKGSAEVLVAGRAHAPGGEPAPRVAVRLAVGTLDKRLRVVGDREWRCGLLAPARVGAPRPFACLPMDWSRAFGGARHADNPAGRSRPRGAPWRRPRRGPMPNVEYADEPIRTPHGRYTPAGLGPTDIRRPARQALAGSCDTRWLREEAPGLPADVDWHTFNAAPPDQWTDTAWAPGAPYRLEGLHPDGPLAGNLPEIRPRAFVLRRDDPDPQEVALGADTLWLFPEAALGLLIHRGTARIRRADAQDVRAVLAAWEATSAPARAARHYRDTLHARLDPGAARRHAAAEWELAPVAPSEPGAPEGEAAGRAFIDRLLDDIEPLHPIDREAVHAAAAGIPEPPLADPDALAAGEADLGALVDEALERAQAAQADAEARLADLEAEVEGPGTPSDAGAPPATPETIAEQREEAVRRAQGVDAAEALLAGLSGDAAAPQGDSPPGDLREARLRASRPVRPERPLHPEAAAALRALVEAWLREAVALAGRDLAGAELSGLDLSDLDLRGILLERAGLGGASLHGADLREAVLTEADLREADLRGARLDGANLCGVRAHGADLSGASLRGASLLGADLDAARLDDAVLDDCLAHELRARGTCFDRVRAARTLLPNAALRGSRWQGARLREVVLTRAHLEEADFSRAVAGRLILSGARADRSHWTDARLDDLQAPGETRLRAAELRGVRGQRLGLRGADLRGARLDAARLADADLGGARLEGAVFRGARVLRSILTDARVARADFRDADLHGSQCRHLRLSRHALDGAATAGVDWQACEFTDEPIHERSH
jgi:uncharacterized protein YjbI with pentapeptide repeats